MYALYHGTITRGFQFASGDAVGRADNPSPFSAGTLKLQQPYFKAAGFDLEAIPNLFWGTVNVAIGEEMILGKPDLTIERVDWTRGESTTIEPETFSFINCCLAHNNKYYTGYIYYPHPETKPEDVNSHRFDILEILTQSIEDVRYGDIVAVLCAAAAFLPKMLIKGNGAEDAK